LFAHPQLLLLPQLLHELHSEQQRARRCPNAWTGTVAQMATPTTATRTSRRFNMGVILDAGA
jgi:hypothetical protein